ncbi:unnamed protein product [Prorocentrum cordatum]|uniref:Uncharacterized protein n=1 Tax=Prorocentrum cordatum TaxID=2364126 RepID=A0ABN9Q2Q7_9DINO|nr:unnamed protein product [Polarella glacialis]
MFLVFILILDTLFFGVSLQSARNHIAVVASANHRNQTLGDLLPIIVGNSTELLQYGVHVPNVVDMFSASWLMNASLFMRMKAVGMGGIETVEDGCLSVFHQAKGLGAPVAITNDWLDFSVEHLSHYWRAAGVCNNLSTFDDFNSRLDRYISHVQVLDPSPLHDTIAILAFMPYKCLVPDTGRSLTRRLLTATLKSLQRAGIGRVVVVSDKPTHEYEPRSVSFGNTEVAFVTVDASTTKSKFIERNIPRGAIYGLQQAIRSKDVGWLGHDTGRWQSVFLTEPDQILHFKPRSIVDLARAVESGFVLAPHRLQPVPHPSDVRVPENPIPETSSAFKVETVESDDVKCIDAGGDHPGDVDLHPSGSHEPGCSTWWWKCGFKDGNHSRLDHYPAAFAMVLG